MGLDQYLKARKYISGYDFSEEKDIYTKVVEAAGFSAGDIQNHSPSGYIELTVAYWRKSSQIHNWFVKNCQNGVDDCGTYFVEQKQLETLRDLCKEVVQTKDTSKLETTKGFFFGSTEYDKYYFRDLQDTIEQLDSILNNPKFEDWNFYYHSSW